MKMIGYVYVLSNKCVVSRNGKPVLKVGFTSNLPRRLGTLNTSAPENFKVVALFETAKYKDLEKFSKEYINGALLTSDGSYTEFFDKKLDYIIGRIKKCATDHRITLKKIDGSKYVGRSESAIRRNLQDRRSNEKGWPNPTQLAKAIVKKFAPSQTYGHVFHLLTRFRPCKSGIWKDRLERVGLTFDNAGFVKDWKKAKRVF